MEYIKLKDLCEKEERFVAPNDDAHIDYVDISSVDNKSKSLTKYDTYIFAEAPSRARKRVKHGDVIVSTVRPNLNAVARFNIQTPHTPIASTGFCVLRHKSDVDPIYIYFFCISPNFVRQMVAKATGASYPAVSDTIVREAKLPKHTAEKRIRIVSTLSKAKEIIEHRRAQLAKLDELVKCRFVELFGDPVSNPMGWATKRIHEVAPHSPIEIKTESNDIWLLNLDKIESHTGRVTEYVYIHPDEIGTSTCGFDCRHVLYSKLRPYLNKVVVPNQSGMATSELLALCPNEELNREFLAHLLRSDNFVGYISEKVAGAKMPRVSMDIFRAFPCILPPMTLQNTFVSFVQRIDKLRFVVEMSHNHKHFTICGLVYLYANPRLNLGFA